MDREAAIARIKEIIVSSLDLEDVTPAEIETDAPLFGEGLGLDSIDALELGMAIKKEFGAVFSKDAAENKRIFSSVASLADHVLAHGQSANADKGTTK